jgi:excisionase family DNA binding protein
MTERLLTCREVAELLGVSSETILRWHRRGQLPSIRLPSGAIRFDREALDAWLAERATPRRGSVSHPAGRRPTATLQVSATPEDEE